ncbi:MAG TPA: membrane dipeptidase [Nitrolancea sp.]|nr:membrane dipeptidase [Nitrolancea sp.]
MVELIGSVMLPTEENKGFHGILEQDHPYFFIDGCMQAWPDADYANAHRHGVTAYAATAWMPQIPLDQALEQAMFWHLVARKHPNLLVAETADDIRRAKREGKAAIIMAAQDGDFIGNQLHRIEAFYRLGLRMMLPAYNASNLICGGALDRDDRGLTRFGELVVAEANRVGLLLDCTHVGKRSTLEIIDRSEQPVVFSHSNPNSIVPNPRNIDDDQIAACVARGGVIGLAPWGPLVMKPGQHAQPSVDDFIDHIDYVVQLTGSTNHVGIGTDMSLGTYPLHTSNPWGDPGYPDVSAEYGKYVTTDVRSPQRALSDFHQYPQVINLIDRLQARGYDDDDVSKILGGNFLRIFEAVWK